MVELDEEPPHKVNEEALEIALEIALLLNCKIPEEIHVMRKTVIDGSNTSGFQRTMIVGMNGRLDDVEIKQVCLEEEAAGIVKKEKDKTYYRLDRLGIPLVEISTGIIEKSPEDVQRFAEKLGMLLRSTGKILRGIGTIRQDLNISIKGGARVEIKGVQELKLIAKIIKNEIKRQLNLIKKGKKVKEETRVANPDGTSSYTRPLPGAERMYPETDVPAIKINKELLEKIKKNLPELLEEKEEKLVKKYNLNKELVKELIRSEKINLFEKIVSLGIEPILIATTLTSTLKELKRKENAPIENLKEKHFLMVFEALKSQKIAKEGIPELLKQLSLKPEEKIENLIKSLGLETISEEKLREIIKKIIQENKDVLQKPTAEKIFMGLIMKEVRGKIDGKTVMKVLKEELTNFN